MAAKPRRTICFTAASAENAERCSTWFRRAFRLSAAEHTVFSAFSAVLLPRRSDPPCNSKFVSRDSSQVVASSELNNCSTSLAGRDFLAFASGEGLGSEPGFEYDKWGMSGRLHAGRRAEFRKRRGFAHVLCCLASFRADHHGPFSAGLRLGSAGYSLL